LIRRSRAILDIRWQVVTWSNS